MRALRRHHYARLKKKRASYYSRQPGLLSPVDLGMAVSTAKRCSCWMCGNPRRHRNEITLTEARHAAQLAEDVADLC